MSIKKTILISATAVLLVACFFVTPILFPQISTNNATGETKMEQINSDGSTTIIEPIADGDSTREDVERLMNVQSQAEDYISEFDHVESVVVSISIVDPSKPVAAVLVKVSDGSMLSNVQVDDIRNYLTSSVKNLQADSISISTADGQIIQ